MKLWVVGYGVVSVDPDLLGEGEALVASQSEERALALFLEGEVGVVSYPKASAVEVPLDRERVLYRVRESWPEDGS